MAKPATAQESKLTLTGAALLVLGLLMAIGFAKANSGTGQTTKKPRGGFDVSAEWNAIEGGVRIQIFVNGVLVVNNPVKHSTSYPRPYVHFVKGTKSSTKIVITVKPLKLEADPDGPSNLFASIVWRGAPPPVKLAVNDPTPSSDGVRVEYPDPGGNR